ncbi:MULTISPECIES: hypothetical protein [Providencia]|nr:hypothetical protein [Providencia sp. PROV024]EJD6080731.1 hypothetical protein [Providencia rettgeri]EJD6600325.1 hypothetical protein [Providencia rettgeri]WOC02952.1 hypothetical protein P3L56_14180 [Providencia sp. PROV024]
MAPFYWITMIIIFSKFLRELNSSGLFENINYDLYPKLGVIYGCDKEKREIKITLSTLNDKENRVTITVQSDVDWNKRKQLRAVLINESLYISHGDFIYRVTPIFIRNYFFKFDIIDFLSIVICQNRKR